MATLFDDGFREAKVLSAVLSFVGDLNALVVADFDATGTIGNGVRLKVSGAKPPAEMI